MEPKYFHLNLSSISIWQNCSKFNLVKWTFPSCQLNSSSCQANNLVHMICVSWELVTWQEADLFDTYWQGSTLLFAMFFAYRDIIFSAYVLSTPKNTRVHSRSLIWNSLPPFILSALQSFDICAVIDYFTVRSSVFPICFYVRWCLLLEFAVVIESYSFKHLTIASTYFAIRISERILCEFTSVTQTVWWKPFTFTCLSVFPSAR